MQSLWIVITVYFCSAFVVGLKVSFDGFDQTFGENVMQIDMRVRKYNRTSSVLNGTMHLLENSDNRVQYKLDIYYSRLGNQQYNYLPMKLPTEGVCDFLNNLHVVYPEAAAMFTNFPAPNECPISARDIYVLDKEFPSNIWPIVLQKPGLWKLDIS
uniref:Uncharacterized protein n=1 Tax=Anopheles epiroticus TaxID=199890 RepID=A0A182PLD0_9DIPT